MLFSYRNDLVKKDDFVYKKQQRFPRAFAPKERIAIPLHSAIYHTHPMNKVCPYLQKIELFNDIELKAAV